MSDAAPQTTPVTVPAPIPVPAALPVTQDYPSLPKAMENPNFISLSQQQLIAIESILMGKNQGEVAQDAGVTRKTVYNWRHNDAAFRFELEARQQILYQASIDRLRALIPKAVYALKSDVEATHRSTRARAASIILRLANLKNIMPAKL